MKIYYKLYLVNKLKINMFVNNNIFDIEQVLINMEKKF